MFTYFSGSGSSGPSLSLQVWACAPGTVWVSEGGLQGACLSSTVCVSEGFVCLGWGCSCMSPWVLCVHVSSL